MQRTEDEPQTAVVGRRPYKLAIHVLGNGQLESVTFDGRLWRADGFFPPGIHGGRTLHATMTLDKQGTATTPGKATVRTTGEVVTFTQLFVGCA